MAYKPTRMETIKRIISLHTEGYSIKRNFYVFPNKYSKIFYV